MIKYREGYKYQLAETYHVVVNFPIDSEIRTEFIHMDPIDDYSSSLYIKSGYAWDGPSGPTFDTPDSMRPSLVHDALYQLMRATHLPRSLRDEIDDLLLTHLIEDGMDERRAKIWYAGVRWFAGQYADPENVKKILTAP